VTSPFNLHSLLRNYLKLFGEDSCVLIHFITFTKCFKIVDRKSFLNTQNPGTSELIALFPPPAMIIIQLGSNDLGTCQSINSKYRKTYSLAALTTA
jgi:hypothetical protein